MSDDNTGQLARACGQELFLQVLRSAAGFYTGTADADGLPFSRESIEYWRQRSDADKALSVGRWTQKLVP